MITGNIKDCERYYSVHKDLESVFQYLKNGCKAEEGGQEANGGKRPNVTVSSIKTMEGEPRVFEAHRKYIDVHYIISGEEAFGYAQVDSLSTVQAYKEEADCEFLKGEINTIVLRQGDFCITFPEDAHIPFLTKRTEELVRAVAKLAC